VPHQKFRVGVVDDDEDFLAIMIEILREAGGTPVPFASAEPAIAAIATGALDAVLTDFRLAGPLGGEEVVRACHAPGCHVPVAVMSVVDSADVAVQLVRLGADDYLVKPTLAIELLPKVKLFLDAARLRRDATRVSGLLSAGASGFAARLLEASPALKPLLTELPRAAQSGANVLIQGESGTGKELAARALHELSRRAAGPFVAIDCGAIPENLLENELFGHRRGAYSDAREDRDGVVQRAHGGTLFLDEIGELPMSMQAKLLRFMQTREYRRLGDSKVMEADLRFVAATHRDLKSAVAERTFRQDLFYRINVIQLELPPLRERAGDIPLLAQAFVNKYAAQFDSPALEIGPEALAQLSSCRWEGNVRELENAVQRAVALATGSTLDVSAFRLSVPRNDAQSSAPPSGRPPEDFAAAGDVFGEPAEALPPRRVP